MSLYLSIEFFFFCLLLEQTKCSCAQSEVKEDMVCQVWHEKQLNSPDLNLVEHTSKSSFKTEAKDFYCHTLLPPGLCMILYSWLIVTF